MEIITSPANTIFKKGVFISGLCSVLVLPVACTDSKVETRLVGYVDTEWVYVAAPGSGWLVASEMRPGGKVLAGDLLFTLDNDEQLAAVNEAKSRAEQAEAEVRDIAVGARPDEIRVIEAQIDEANARLVRATAEKERILPLVKMGIESQSLGEQVEANYKIAQANLKAAQQSLKVAKLAGRDAARDAAHAAQRSAQAALEIARWRLDQRTIRSKISGRIEEIFHYPGEYVSSGIPVVAILPESGLKVEFFVPQEKLPSLTIGQTVKVYADGLSGAVDANISFIADDPEYTPPVIYSEKTRDKLVFLVEAKLPDTPGLHPGLPVEIDGL